VTLSYRGDSFKRTKQGNQSRLASMLAERRLTALLESNVARFTAADVSIKLKDGTVTTLPNQQAFVLIGADTPVAWLENLGVRFVDRPHLYALGSTEDAVRRVAPDAVQCSRDPAEAIANLLGRPSPRPGRLRSVVGDVVHEVTAVIRMPVREATGQFRKLHAREATAQFRKPEAQEVTGQFRKLRLQTPLPLAPDDDFEETTWVDWMKGAV
jgi:hypothetical protein